MIGGWKQRHKGNVKTLHLAVKKVAFQVLRWSFTGLLELHVLLNIPT